mmetsp:Transcript_81908/g.171355  ORF Transcript_81908/g.171355 Transcript_81908/m.171355 type:complete len:222 (-) Transcript_81908:215-880(-)
MPVVVARDPEEDREDCEPGEEHAPNALEAYYLHSRQVALSKQVLLSNHLCGLHHLPRKGKADTDEHGPKALLLRLVRILWLSVSSQNAREPYQENSDGAKPNAIPMKAVDSFPQKNRRKARGEDHLGTAEELPDTRRNVEKTHGAEPSGEDVEESRSSDHPDFATPRWALWRGVPTALQTVRAIQGGIEGERKAHGQEHHERHEPGLLEHLLLPLQVLTLQ